VIERCDLLITSRAKATFSNTVFFSSNRKSWNTQPIPRRSSGTLRAGSLAMSLPLTMTLPLVGTSSRNSSRSTEDLPDPEAPIRKTNSPLSMSRDTPSRAGRVLAA
jgi:hypothetical protein